MIKLVAAAALLAPLSLLATPASASDVPPETLTIDTAVQEALGKNPDVKRVQAAEQEASWKRLDAISANLPHFGVNVNHLFDAKFQVEYVASFNTTFPEIAPYTIASLGVAWTVFDGFQGWNSYQAARRVHQATALEVESTEFGTAETVRLRFYEALGAQILADVAAQNVATLNDHLQKTRDILRRGSATKYDLLRVQVQLEEALSDKDAADDNIALARKNLSVQMGMADDNRRLSGDLPIPQEGRIPADLQGDFTAREDLQALDKRADAADRLYYSSLGAWVPKVTLTGEKDYYNNLDTSLSSTNFHDAYAIGVQLSWNILDGGATIARQFETKYQGDQAEATAAAAALRAPQDFETYKRRYIYNASLYRAKKRAVDMAEESVRLAKLGYGAGTRTSTDVLDAELDLIRARADVVRAQVNGAEALINLELSLGKRI